MIRYKLTDFEQGFKDIGMRRGDVLVIHSSLFNFGIPENEKISSLPSDIYSILMEIVGSEGTVAVPTFNFDFCRGIPFNRQSTPPKLMGNFSEYIFSLKTCIRSYHPMQSVSVVGKYAANITINDTPSSFADNGPWAMLEQLNAKVLLLGASFNSPSIFHMIEEREQVPYRYWKSFSGKYIDNGLESDRTYKMYVRELNPLPLLNLSSLEHMLANNHWLKSVQIGGGKIACFNASDFICCAKEKIRNNPHYFVSNHGDYLKDHL